jgi:hypothetical protein
VEFLKEWRTATARIPAIILLDGIAVRLPGKRRVKDDVATRRRLAAILLFVVLELAQLVLMILVSRPVKPVIGPTIVTSFITSLCAYAVAYCHQYVLDEWQAVAEAGLVSEETQSCFLSWIQTWTNLLYQLLACATVVIILVGYALLFDVFINKWDAIAMVSLMALGGGQGFYWGIVTPLLTEQLRRVPPNQLEHDFLYPSMSPLLRKLSRMLLVFAGWIAMMFTFVVVFLLMMRSELRENASIYAWLAVSIGYVVSGWIFGYSQFNLSRIVSQFRENTLIKLQNEINKTFKSLESMKQQDFERLQALMAIHDVVTKTSKTVLDFSTLRTFLLSSLSPTVAAIIGLIDWNRFLKGLAEALP